MTERPPFSLSPDTFLSLNFDQALKQLCHVLTLLPHHTTHTPHTHKTGLLAPNIQIWFKLHQTKNPWELEEQLLDQVTHIQRRIKYKETNYNLKVTCLVKTCAFFTDVLSKGLVSGTHRDLHSLSDVKTLILSASLVHSHTIFCCCCSMYYIINFYQEIKATNNKLYIDPFAVMNPTL